MGGNRPQRGIQWGKPPPTRDTMGETAPNAGYNGGNRPQRGIQWGKQPPTRDTSGYCQGYRKGYRWLLSRI
jgi:hypothetical protein